MSSTKVARRGHLATPLSAAERREMARLYREHGGLVRHMRRKLYSTYHKALRCEDIYSCIDVAFIKTCRAWNPAKGRFSTLFGAFCTGEVRHFLRDNNWAVYAPRSVRIAGSRIRGLLRSGSTVDEICTQLDITPEDMRLAIFSVQSLDHETRDFRYHACPRPTPWDALEQREGAN
jgi:DNA-directed RNA polymerase specialized sigma subunit